MNHVNLVKAVFLFTIVLSLLGCKSKQEQPISNSGAQQEKASAPVGTSTQNKPVAPTVLPQDMKDARAAAVRVLALMETGDFPAIYKGSADGFKQIGSESQFVEKFQQTRKSVGVLKSPQEISFGTLPGNGYVFVYRVENEHYKSDLRLTFARSPSGKMELAGLNQHDEAKK
jgi:hypothetical protein